MITQQFLQSCTDEQINKGVAWVNSCKVNNFWFDHEIGVLFKHSRNSGEVYRFDPCTNPNDIMPIAFDNKFLIEPPNFFTDNWTVTSFYIIENIGERSIKVTNKNPLRAICEVYILMSVNK